MAAAITGTTTIDTFLMQNTGEPMSATWEKVIDITDYPDLGGEPEKIDITTLSDHIRKNLNGIQEVDTLSFGWNYTKDNYTKMHALDRQEKEYAVWFGASGVNVPDGHDGKFKFTGSMVSWATGGGVNEARKGQSAIALVSEIELDEA